MASEPVHIHDDSEQPGLIERAADEPVRFERKGIVYQLRAETEGQRESQSSEDRERALKSLRAAAGSWSEIDADKVIEELYEARRLGSRPESRP